MADEITLSSTTATQDEMNAALGIAPETPAKGEVEDKPKEAEQEVAQDQERKAEPHGKVKKSAQDRINELTREKYELRERLARLEGTQGKAKTDETPAKADAATKLAVVPTRPKPDKDDPKYKTYEEYTDDLVDWKVEQSEAVHKAEEAQKTKNERLREKFDNLNAQITEAKTRYPDWDEVASDESLRVPKIFEVAIPEFSNGADMMYYVATHNEFREKLLGMNDGVNDFKIIHELSRLSDYLLDRDEAAKGSAAIATIPDAKKPAPTVIAAAKTTASTAPEPIKPVGSASAATAKRPLDEAPFQEYKRRRLAGEGR